MKKLFIAALLLASMGFTYAQNEVNNQNQKSTEINERLSEAEKVEYKKLKMKLEALDRKEEWIRSNPEEMKIAEETNWFINANNTRKEIRKRIKELEAK